MSNNPGAQMDNNVPGEQRGARPAKAHRLVERVSVFARVKPDFICAMMETSPHICGNYKKAWTMTLLRRGTRCRLPRDVIGGSKPVFVGG